jgi:UDP-N-acetylglucosamine--N-acetylmuramyl-(pentapeptide) pyrophosphoryl-undecaprenol N-acetylglucosamine transferase
MTDANLHIAIASGGTGGHFYPTLAIAKAALRQGHDVTLFVAGHHAREQLDVAQTHGIRAVAVPASRLPRSVAATVTFPVRFSWSVLQAFRAVGRVDPDVVLGMGSFAAVPVCLGALFRRLPLVLHEGNSLMGLANRKLARWARAVATSLPLADEHAAPCRTVRTGMPLRDAILEAARPGTVAGQTAGKLGLQPGVPTVLVFGGSQGAQFINGLLAATAPLVAEAGCNVQFIHLTGTDENAELANAYERAGLRARIARSDPQIQRCYLLAGLVVCRGGASSLSELALFAKPAITIPLPTAADDHQTVNARVLSDRGAVYMLTQADAKPGALASLIKDWCRDAEPWLERARRLGDLAAPDASNAVVQLLTEIARS